MQVSLSWLNTAGATSWNVYRSQTSGGPYVRCGITTTPQWVDTNNLPKNVTFYYVVTAVNQDGESQFSAQITATAPATPLAPTGVQVVVV
jgi:hypothetical protein